VSAPGQSDAHPFAVLDSSALVPRWARERLQQLALPPGPAFTPFWSEWIIAETWRVLAERWFRLLTAGTTPDLPRLRRDANAMMRHLLPVMRLVTLRGYGGPPPWPGLTDVNDYPIWHTAIVAGAQYVVSQNTRHFPPLVDGRHVYEGVEYVTAIEFIEDVLGASAAEDGEPLPPGASLRSRRRR
jgi:hypothetical protein